MLDKKLLEIIVCPVCKGSLVYKPEQNELLCKADRMAFPIKDDIPVLLAEQARVMSREEMDQLT